MWCPGEERGRGRCVTSEEVRLDRPASETGRLCGRPHASRGAALLELGCPLRGRGGGGARIAPGIRIHFGFVRGTVKISRGAGHVPTPPTSTPPSSPRLPPPPIHAFPHPRRRPTAPIPPDGATRPAPALPDAQPHRAAPPDAQPHRAAPPHTVPHPPHPAAREPDMDPNTRGNPRPSPTPPQPRAPLVGVGTHAAPLPCCRALHRPYVGLPPLFVVSCLCAAGISLPQCGVCPASSVGSGTVGLFIINYYCQKPKRD